MKEPRPIPWRLFTLSAASAAFVCLASTAMWLRGFVATDVWASHRYDPASRVLDSRTVKSSHGWFFTVRSSTLMPPGATPRYPHPMDSTWVHASGPPNMPGRLPTGARGSLVFSHRATPGAATSPAPRSFRVLSYSDFGARWVLVITVASLLPGLWVALRVRAFRRGRRQSLCGFAVEACGPEKKRTDAAPAPAEHRS